LIIPHTVDERSRQKEIIMHAQEQTPLWGIHIGGGRAKDAKGWYQHLWDWWVAHKAARRAEKLASLHTCWDSQREVVTPFHTGAAHEMAAAQYTLSVATMLYGLSE
jgi:hypothetical protein